LKSNEQVHFSLVQFDDRRECCPVALPVQQLSPTDREFRSMLAALERRFGSIGARDLIGLDSNIWHDWRIKKRKPSFPARKAVWLVWSLTLHPEQVTSLWDIATYGRFHGQQILEPDPPEYEI
jgi:hypothetical protein